MSDDPRAPTTTATATPEPQDYDEEMDRFVAPTAPRNQTSTGWTAREEEIRARVKTALASTGLVAAQDAGDLLTEIRRLRGLVETLGSFRQTAPGKLITPERERALRQMADLLIRHGGDEQGATLGTFVEEIFSGLDALRASTPDANLAAQRVADATRETGEAVQLLLRLLGPLTDDEKRGFMWGAPGGPNEMLMMNASSVLHAAKLLAMRARVAQITE